MVSVRQIFSEIFLGLLLQGMELSVLTGAKVAVVVVTPRGVRHEFISTPNDTEWASFSSSTSTHTTRNDRPEPAANTSRSNSYSS